MISARLLAELSQRVSFHSDSEKGFINGMLFYYSDRSCVKRRSEYGQKEV